MLSGGGYLIFLMDKDLRLAPISWTSTKIKSFSQFLGSRGFDNSGLQRQNVLCTSHGQRDFESEEHEDDTNHGLKQLGGES